MITVIITNNSNGNNSNNKTSRIVKTLPKARNQCTAYTLHSACKDSWRSQPPNPAKAERRDSFMVHLYDFESELPQQPERNTLASATLTSESTAWQQWGRQSVVDKTSFHKKIGWKWTWTAPDAKSKSEIDYVMIGTRLILKDASVVPSINTESDHRLQHGQEYIQFLLLRKGY